MEEEKLRWRTKAENIRTFMTNGNMLQFGCENIFFQLHLTVGQISEAHALLCETMRGSNPNIPPHSNSEEPQPIRETGYYYSVS